jgi:hypothetical protein
MSGGITQLVSVGVQDRYLIGNPEVSFFKTNYRRHTNFSQCVDNLAIQGNPTASGISTIDLTHKGDMVSFMYLSVNDGTTALPIDWSTVIDKVELLIGGQVIDSQDYTFMNDLAIDLLAQNVSRSFLGSHYSGGTSDEWFFPFRFFCCENSNSALPLISLQYHDVVVRITWSAAFDNSFRFEFNANYIYLDTIERGIFSSSKSQEMLIYQVQKKAASNEKVQEIYFSHPVKFIVAKGGGVCTSNASLVTTLVNGTELGNAKYPKPNYTVVASYYYSPYSVGNTEDYFLYSFCLDTSTLQPTGTLNFSRIDSARFVSDNETFTTDLYAVNYNILKMENGMGGLLYAD